MEHFKVGQIRSYIDKQIIDSEANEIEVHLVTCQKCYEVYISLQSIEATLSSSFNEEIATDSCPSDWELGALVMEELSSEISKNISSHVRNCGFCIERFAAYYKTLISEKKVLATPELWKQKAIQSLSAADYIKESHVPLHQRVLHLFTKQCFTIPVAASFAAAILVVAVIVWMIIPGKARFIAVASSEKLAIRDSEMPATFGFSGTNELKEVNSMEISSEGEEVIFKWEPIGEATEYKFSFRNIEGVVQAQKTITQPVISLGKDLIQEGILYSWLISGKTGNGKYFEYTGNFILEK